MNRAKCDEHKLGNMLLQRDREVAEAYRVEGTPGAVLVQDGRIASMVATGADAIQGLLTRATLPPSVKKGDPVPSLKLQDLNGKMVDLLSLKGRRTLILFWNPSCGFCQQMLEDVKSWERTPPKGAPELLVISAGPLEDNRKQGFRSRVLLDPYFLTSQVFNSGGTPSAVVIDEEGRVTSEVAAGAPEVLAMAREVSTANSQPV